MSQLSLFASEPRFPAGFRYHPDVLSRADEQMLLDAFAALPFAEFKFHGFEGKRRVVSFGWKYDFESMRLDRTEDMPAFLLPIRTKAAGFAGLAAESLQQVLLTEYPPGATIGWHKDRPVFGDVVGLSLRAPCTFRFRRKEGTGWERVSLTAEPRSAYLLQGPSRSEWEHSIPPVADTRYSITFRNIKAA
jgi:alkylated DNA repair dioxygenase AlkB